MLIPHLRRKRPSSSRQSAATWWADVDQQYVRPHDGCKGSGGTLRHRCLVLVVGRGGWLVLGMVRQPTAAMVWSRRLWGAKTMPWLLPATPLPSAIRLRAAEERHGIHQFIVGTCQGHERHGTSGPMGLSCSQVTAPLRGTAGTARARAPHPLRATIRRLYSRISSWRTPAKITERVRDPSRTQARSRRKARPLRAAARNIPP